jgi:membrane protein DedA with SNARE-associated domain
MEKNRFQFSKTVFIVVTSFAAVLIFSFTIGKDIYDGKNQSLSSFGLIHFSGYLFFLLMPVEMAFIYYLTFQKKVVLILLALGTAVIAQIIDYLIGISVSSRIINKLVGVKRIKRAEKYIKKYGNITVFIFNILPLSSPVIALVAGMLKFSFKDLMLYSICGLVLKYILLSLIF